MLNSTSGTAPENSNYSNRSGPRLVRRPVAKKLDNIRRKRLSEKPAKIKSLPRYIYITGTEAK